MTRSVVTPLGKKGKALNIKPPLTFTETEKIIQLRLITVSLKGLGTNCCGTLILTHGRFQLRPLISNDGAVLLQEIPSCPSTIEQSNKGSYESAILSVPTPLPSSTRLEQLAQQRVLRTNQLMNCLDRGRVD